ncbi:hypothetical protein [Rhodovulum sp. MB263]|uniref:hypothetical protein n=1 Tax=Rhodovulum sp. (strain MB263) TaxID=308754 RepID=UPI0009B75AB8|nr:hypothetical protein [Rhodovulum sp. MB263]ARC90663.1 hypothetical protein B5V46_18420 [Rhodovulum sp. MB263]
MLARGSFGLEDGRRPGLALAVKRRLEPGLVAGDRAGRPGETPLSWLGFDAVPGDQGALPRQAAPGCRAFAVVIKQRITRSARPFAAVTAAFNGPAHLPERPGCRSHIEHVCSRSSGSGPLAEPGLSSPKSGIADPNQTFEL